MQTHEHRENTFTTQKVPERRLELRRIVVAAAMLTAGRRQNLNVYTRLRKERKKENRKRKWGQTIVLYS